MAFASVASVAGLWAIQLGVSNAISRTQNTRRRERTGTTSEMSKRVSACGATSDHPLPPTNAVRSAKIATLVDQTRRPSRVAVCAWTKALTQQPAFTFFG